MELELGSAIENETRNTLPAATTSNDNKSAEPLPPMDPEETGLTRQTYDQDTIVVQPPRLPRAWGSEPAPTAPEHSSSERPRRIRQQREMFRPAAWQALMAIAGEPTTLEDALASEDAPEWRNAWKGELESLKKNGTWVIERVPENRNIVGCRWLFKRKEDGRLKVRLVAKGY